MSMDVRTRTCVNMYTYVSVHLSLSLSIYTYTCVLISERACFVNTRDVGRHLWRLSLVKKTLSTFLKLHRFQLHC